MEIGFAGRVPQTPVGELTISVFDNRRQGDPQEKKDARVNQFLDVLKRAIGA